MITRGMLSMRGPSLFLGTRAGKPAEDANSQSSSSQWGQNRARLQEALVSRASHPSRGRGEPPAALRRRLWVNSAGSRAARAPP